MAGTAWPGSNLAPPHPPNKHRTRFVGPRFTRLIQRAGVHRTSGPSIYPSMSHSPFRFLHPAYIMEVSQSRAASVLCPWVHEHASQCNGRPCRRTGWDQDRTLERNAWVILHRLATAEDTHGRVAMTRTTQPRASSRAAPHPPADLLPTHNSSSRRLVSVY
jgi:hypothetical protein